MRYLRMSDLPPAHTNDLDIDRPPRLARCHRGISTVNRPSRRRHKSMRILFIGESWQGSCARSLREALERRSDVHVDAIDEGDWFSRPRGLLLRAMNRLTSNPRRWRFSKHVIDRVRTLRPQIVLAYKGYWIHEDLIHAVRDLGARAVNVYPDCSPHRYGGEHRRAVGEYDIVLSTKPFHPSHWSKTYGYTNRCEFIPHGYDPHLHLVAAPPTVLRYDVVVVATYRNEYGRLMIEFARALKSRSLRVAIGGYGWHAIRSELPQHWELCGPVQGPRYVTLLRQGKICIAPISRDVTSNGRRQPGDVDSTRTYELAAAHCFFLHRRTEYARSLYTDREVPMYDSAADLAELVEDYVARDEVRAAMALRAHRRAVPAYSLDARAEAIVNVLKGEWVDQRW